MRIKSLLAVFSTGLILAVMGCGTEAEQVPASEPAPVEAQASQQSMTPLAICPMKWTCNYQRYYGTQEQCTAACGSTPCERDYACTGSCVCP
ncbi:hypothetical protein [Vitiosangium sp. GDMCC 1.1324]|uniref:hypothetical protein n=1 Tax=Vitiosangium sp. (strain GDMCC 1.1324) TaxID=2138576 RepID=UPI000D3841B6|nr:hypothetical protein [Vitiosangium sp. GDMCC 1.1324]PTL81165.1 hypothetical protein DAT35_23870 [Vitiosangium sp. GDMCC 1.1324]